MSSSTRNPLVVVVLYLILPVGSGCATAQVPVAPEVTRGALAVVNTKGGVGKTTVPPPPGNAASLDLAAARGELTRAIENAYSGVVKLNLVANNLQVYAPRDLEVHADGLSFTRAPDPREISRDLFAAEGRVSVEFKDLDYVAVVEQKWSKPGTFFYVGPQGRPVKSGARASKGFLGDSYYTMAGYPLWTNRATAQRCADAANRLIWAARDPEGELGRFQQRTASWQRLATKPQLPEGANRERILAENAVREKDSRGAVAHYERGLELYETWPEAWFNLALIHAELHHYADAVDSINRYLALAPDAPDAPAARDQLVIWTDKASQAVAHR